MRDNRDFQRIILPILLNEKMQLTKKFVQHGNVSVFAHSVAVAVYSERLARALRIRHDMKSLIRGALLHDFFLYDWHKTSNIGDGLHGFAHPYTALKNASLEFSLNPLEKDIIRKHMWPLTLTKLPTRRESWLVCLVDKYCSVLETLHLSRYNDGSFVNDALLSETEMKEAS